MSRKLALATIAAAFALCLALAGCGGGSGSTSSDSGSAPSDKASSETSSSAADDKAPSEEAASSAETASDNHDSYFVGKWELYETEDATHEQISQVMEKYANDEEFRKQMNESYGRDSVEFCAQFNADGTGEMDTGLEIVPFTWEASNEGAVTFTSFGGKETAKHVPVTDGKFTLDGDTYAKAS